MKNEQTEQWVLLEQSGELDLIGRWRLRRALARSPELRAWRDELSLLRTRVREQAPAVPPTPRDVLAAITEAARQTPAKAAAWRFNPAWSAAAASALVLAAWMTIAPTGFRDPGTPVIPETTRAATTLAWDDGLDQRLADLYVQLGTSTESTQDSATAEDELDTLAGAVLAEEGIQI